jgi:uncharacterized protein YbjT (DUF2867 family)
VFSLIAVLRLHWWKPEVTNPTMHVILGATGHVGSAVAMALLDRREPVIVVTRDERRAEPFTRRGAIVAVTDVHDTDALRDALTRGRSAFLLMPPADLSTDTVAEERRTVSSVARALEGTGLQKVVVQSTYGAQPGDGIGDLGVLYEFEQAVLAVGLRTSIVRGAYYMSNWDSALETARDEGTVHTFLPSNFALPMVAPADLGGVAARLLTEEIAHTGVRYVEGPATYSPADVAAAFARALGRDVRTIETPRSELASAFRALGFSEVAAASYARMTELTIDSAERPEAPERGQTTLTQYVSSLVSQKADGKAQGVPGER